MNAANRPKSVSAASIAREFSIPGELSSIKPLGSGNINDTYLATYINQGVRRQAVIQRINRDVFKHPERIMKNMRVVADHLRRRQAREKKSGPRALQIPELIPCKNGDDFFVDASGAAWRALTLIEGSKSHDAANDAEHAYEAGRVLGEFHRLLSDLDPGKVQETLPGFHISPLYLRGFDAAKTSTVAQHRLRASAEAQRLNRFVESRRELAGVLESAKERGELVLRLIHGDPKVNNVLIDIETGRGTGIVDLDTVQPGLIHYDFGDALRSIANRAGEESEDLDAVDFDLELCKGFCRGYWEFASEFLTAEDRKYLYDSIRLIAYELGLRFFTDFLSGDVYFKTSYPEQNLIRARVQFRLCERIEHLESKIRSLLP